MKRNVSYPATVDFSSVARTPLEADKKQVQDQEQGQAVHGDGTNSPQRSCRLDSPEGSTSEMISHSVLQRHRSPPSATENRRSRSLFGFATTNEDEMDNRSIVETELLRRLPAKSANQVEGDFDAKSAMRIGAGAFDFEALSGLSFSCIQQFPQIMCCGSIGNVYAITATPPPVKTIEAATPIPAAQPESSTAQKAETPGQKNKHFRWFGHGKLWTCIALCCAWSGSMLSILSRLSVNFVDLDFPVDVSPLYEPISQVGMIRIELCVNETLTSQTGCTILRLSSDTVQDKTFELSRSFLTLGTTLGVLLSAVLTTSVYWETINLRPIGFAFLLSYLFQTFSMLFFRTTLCQEHKCSIGTGGILCILASFCWVGACVAAAKMDLTKIRAARARRSASRKKARQERRERRERREQKRQIDLMRKLSGATSVTDETASRSSNEDNFDIEEGLRELDIAKRRTVALP